LRRKEADALAVVSLFSLLSLLLLSSSFDGKFPCLNLLLYNTGAEGTVFIRKFYYTAFINL
jgi:hypothetical protein